MLTREEAFNYFNRIITNPRRDAEDEEDFKRCKLQLDRFIMSYAQLRARIAELEAEVASLEAERRRDALDGQAALDESNNEVERLRKAHIELAKEHGALLETLFKVDK